MFLVTPKRSHGERCFHAVDDDFQIATALAQRFRLRQFRWHHTDGVENIGDACRKKLFSLFERGHRDAARARIDLALHYVNAFARFHMRPQSNSERVHAVLHGVDVGLHALRINERDGRG